jgi:hypothetical protein
MYRWQHYTEYFDASTFGSADNGITPGFPRPVLGTLSPRF